ncbi:hypothetical protein MACH09_37400 [Vibrio sp. MACH09]|uniref:hypothetical protein n=1 Tax=Vibrio sp. MACH09 TaxID=3025122 RepID=UPI00278F9161|nr:hypothetical protein [Vibrio sp. MACH09]GLO63232.1 hypothetical protein MACH09_37400 [Vibrio sp. MACH09]
MKKNKELKRILSSDRSRKFGIYSASVGGPLSILSFCLFVKMPSPILAVYVLLGVLLFFKSYEVRYTLKECIEYRKMSVQVLLASIFIVLIYAPLAIVFLPLLSVYLTKKMISFYNELVAIEEFKLLHKNTGEDVTEEERKAVIKLCRNDKEIPP